MFASLSELLRLLFAPFIWARSKWARRAIRRQFSLYWKLRHRLGLAQFAVIRTWFRRKHALRESLTTTSLLARIAMAVAPAVLLSVGSVGLLVWIDGSLGEAVWRRLEAAWTDLAPTSVGEPFRQLGRSTVELLSPENSPSDFGLSSLLVTGAQVTGAFLGLYFTAISVVASTAYSNVPTDLRATLLDDRVGNLYLRFVGYVGASCLAALGFVALGYSFGPATVIYFLILTVLAVVSFVRLGKSVFEFFSPPRVIDSLSRQFVDCVKGVSSSGRLAQDPSIQAHYQKRASKRLDAWTDLGDLAMQNEWNATALRSIGRGTLRLLRWYSKAKRRIPDESLWYARKFKHPSFLTADGTRLDLALRTGSLMPSEEPDHLWVENRLQKILHSILKALLRHGHLKACLDLLGSLTSWIAESTRALNPEQIALGFRISDLLTEETDPTPAPTVSGMSDKVYRIAILDAFTHALPVAVSSLTQELRGLELDSFLEDAYASTYSNDVPISFSPGVRANIQFFQDAHRFESNIEGQANTPDWFVHHHVARLMLVDVQAVLTLLLERAEEWLPQRVKSLRDVNESEAAALVVSRAIETIFKLEGAVEQISLLSERLASKKIDTAGTEWPTIDLPGVRQRLSVLHRSLVKHLVPLMGNLPVEPPTGELPDVFGFAHTTLSEAAVEALTTNDEALFGLVYPVLCQSTLLAHARVAEELTDNPIESTLLFAADVFLDLLDISGYAYLMTFALGADTWKVVSGTWDRLLERLPNSTAFIGMVVAEEMYHEGRFTITPRSLIRGQWQARVVELLEDDGFMTGGLLKRGTPKVIPLDSVAASFIGTIRLTSNARDLMLSEYLLRRPEAASVSLPRGVKELRAAARRKWTSRETGRVEG